MGGGSLECYRRFASLLQRNMDALGDKVERGYGLEVSWSARCYGFRMRSRPPLSNSIKKLAVSRACSWMPPDRPSGSR